MKSPAISCLGDPTEQTGTYVLRINVGDDLALAFGRFKQGKVIAVPAGEYLYIGSALGNKGASTLARRLIRHATRSGDRPPHPIRGHMLIVFSSNRPGTADLLPRGPKKLFWNIDYLLDQREADLTHVLVIRNALRWEAGVARHIAPQPFSAILVRGLGANDAPGHTHLLCLCDPPAYWWPRLIDQIETLITDDRAL